MRETASPRALDSNDTTDRPRLVHDGQGARAPATRGTVAVLDTTERDAVNFLFDDTCAAHS